MPVTVLTSWAGSQIGGKTVQLVSGGNMAGQVVMSRTGGQQMVVVGKPTASVPTTNSDGPVTSDTAIAQLAAEAGLLDGEQEGVDCWWG